MTAAHTVHRRYVLTTGATEVAGNVEAAPTAAGPNRYAFRVR